MKNSTQIPKYLIRKSLKLSTAGLCLLLPFLANNAKAAVIYFDPSGSTAVTAGTYTWDTTSTEWATTTALTATPIAWNSVDAACFTAGSFSGNITVDVNGAINLPGLFNGALTPPGCFLTLAGPGTLNWNAGTDGLDSGGSDGGTTTITLQMTGPGQIETEGSASLYLYSANSYTGGTLLGGAGGVNFNNSLSFGTGTITEGRSAMVLASQGTSALNVANPVVTTSADNLTYVGGASAPTTFSGGWTLPAVGLTTTLTVNAGTPLAISGAITGAGNLTKAGAGTLILSGANNYTGVTTLSAGVLQAGAANVIATSSQLTLSGGTFNPGGFGQANTGTLAMTASSTIDFTAGAAAVSFANSSTVAWTGVLNLLNWTSGDLQFGTSSSGLTGTQLADIEFNGANEGIAQLDANGFLVLPTPEPSTIVLGLVGGLGMLWTVRRRSGDNPV